MKKQFTEEQIIGFLREPPSYLAVVLRRDAVLRKERMNHRSPLSP